MCIFLVQSHVTFLSHFLCTKYYCSVKYHLNLIDQVEIDLQGLWTSCGHFSSIDYMPTCEWYTARIVRKEHTPKRQVLQ